MRKKTLLIVMAAVLLTGCGKNAETYNDKGVDYYKAGKNSKAIEAFEEALKIDKNNPAANANMGLAYAKKGDSDKAIEYIEKALEKDAASSENLYYVLAENYFISGRYDEGVKAVENYVNCYPSDYEYYIRGYKLLYKYEMYKTGESLLKQCDSLKQREPQDYNSEGLVQYYLGNYEEARKNFDRARESGYYEAALNVANVDMLLEHYEDALGAYSFYENKNGKSAFILNQKCIAYLKAGKYDDAIQTIEEAVTIADEKEMQEILHNRIVAYEKNANYTKAFEYSKEYIKKYPEDSEGNREYEFLKTRVE